MDRKQFKEILKNKIMVFDGAMGTMLQGELGQDQCPESLNTQKPEIIKSIHKSYIDAGAHVVLTNTFGGNPVKLREYNLQEQTRKINYTAARIAREASQGEAFVAGDVGPTGKLLEPLGELSFEDAVEAFYQQARALVDGGADLIVIETMSDIQELRAAVVAARQVSNKIPVIAQLTFTEGTRTMTGTDPKTAAVVLEAMGVDAIGANCGKGPGDMVDIVSEYYSFSSLPVIVQPNAGIPRWVDGDTVFDLKPQAMAAYVSKFVEAGANIIGGCCGTTPEHIKAIAKAAQGLKPISKKSYNTSALAGRSGIVIIDEHTPTPVIGERINPTGRKELQDALKNMDFSKLTAEARDQVEKGAHILDVNVGLPDINEALAMKHAVLNIQQAVDVPLSIDTKDFEALEEGLKNFAGKALINSVEGRDESLDRILPMAKKYGAAVLGLTIGDKGIPHSAEERFEIANYIVGKAVNYGIAKKDIYIDCLTLSAGAQQELSRETLEAIRIIKQRLGVKTVLGVSNISHGLPNREALNAAFLSMALASGLDLPIINPFSQKVMETLKASDVILNKDKNAQKYINGMDTKTQKEKPRQQRRQDDTSRVYEAILKGERDGIITPLKELEKVKPPLKIIDEVIVPALEKVGDLYDIGIYFLPQLMLAAETAKKACAYLKNKIPQDSRTHKGSIVMATVKGDIHDIGKNIVAVILRQHGFNVIDLGKDVEPETIVEKALQVKPCIVGLSALMTTTIPQMELTIKQLHAADKSIPVIVGGAVVNRKFAEQLGAGYAKDAVEAVSVVKGLMTREKRGEKPNDFF